MADVCLHITSITFLHRDKRGPLCMLLRLAVCDLEVKRKKKDKKKKGRWHNKNSGKAKQLTMPIM